MKPIGYWLRELDRRLEDAFAGALAGSGVSRRDWQVLNGLGADDPFDGQAESVAALVARGWLTPDGTVTPAGAAARAAIRARVDEIRRRSMVGVSEERYFSTVQTLELMALNLAAPA
ncbi:helix-turn-helix domain-containing protein [Dactylosporangium sp. CS-047395]|uniref:helix-turn-helix domain-containing protein n=1 Tax=Dactylosporangium sp. CS-047395 TaxID=3239936 RepID=UPI003D928415